jgi:hypothetical protein
MQGLYLPPYYQLPKGYSRGAKPLSVKGVEPLQKLISPSPFLERGIKGVKLINNPQL